MSTCFRLENPENALTKEELLSRLAPHGITEQTPDEPTQGVFPIADQENNWLWCDVSLDGKISEFSVYCQTINHVDSIIEVLEEVYDDGILSEHDEGFFTEEEEEDMMQEEEDENDTFNE